MSKSDVDVAAQRQEPNEQTDCDEPTSAEQHDRDLVRQALSRTPEERLEVLQDFVDTFWTPQHG